MTLLELKLIWEDKPEVHKYIHETFIEKVNADADLNAHRTFIENNVFGMGERSFQWFWKLMVDELPDNFSFLEIGVHKSQILSLIRLLANRTQKQANIYGITPMDGTGTGWTEDDYEGDIKRLHEHFGLQQPKLYKGLSSEPNALRFAISNEPFDILYVDGSHSYADASCDLVSYTQMIKPGGYLVVDDAACRMNMPFGYFQGIKEVCDALSTWEHTKFANGFEFQFNLVHLMVYKRK